MKKAAKTKVRASARSRHSELGRRTTALKKYLDAFAGAQAKPMSAGRATTPLVLLYKVMGKMFAILSVRGTENVILKCDSTLAHALREEYVGIGYRSHLDRRFWISVDLDADVPAAEVRRLVKHSYALICSGLTRKQQADLAKTSA